MESLSNPIVAKDSYLTLHYRLLNTKGKEIISTFDQRPATLLLGQGQLAPFLEQRLLGLNEGIYTHFDLEPYEAFGERNPALIQRVARRLLKEQSDPDENYRIGDLVHFTTPSGGHFAGKLLELDNNSALFDFNHPLAGQFLRFDVQILGVL